MRGLLPTLCTLPCRLMATRLRVGTSQEGEGQLRMHGESGVPVAWARTEN